MNVCRSCGCHMRRGHFADICDPCDLALTEEARRKGIERRVPPPTVIDQILEILARGPATVTQLAFESGRLESSVRRELLDLIGDGRVERGPKIDGNHGYVLRDVEAVA